MAPSSNRHRSAPTRRPRRPLLTAILALGLAGCGPAPAGDREGAEGPGSGWVAAAEVVRPSVVSVWGSRPVLEGRGNAFAPLGTAFALTRDGLLLTVAHAVAGPDSVPLPRLHVLVQADTANLLFPADLLDVDLHRDLALLRIPDTTLVPVRWATERAPMGAPLATIGYGLPEGGIVDTAEAVIETRYTVFRRFTAGHSSGYRTLEPGDPSTNVLEVDLFLFPGVSGGPTFDDRGRVIGVNRGHRRYRDGVPSSYGWVTPRLVVAQFLAATAVDTARVFR